MIFCANDYNIFIRNYNFRPDQFLIAAPDSKIPVAPTDFSAENVDPAASIPPIVDCHSAAIDHVVTPADPNPMAVITYGAATIVITVPVATHVPIKIISILSKTDHRSNRKYEFQQYNAIN